ncbi:hypothetical protein E2C01_004202 [Portunus trituberculatus]|uniref:Uncharacterized protein n=1 Tax=Portunus trituberculatus TaxID=210409 RepID=A0A5B7CQR8_PORTR|nr:hypothetical protein [Portunus trituberculatus]
MKVRDPQQSPALAGPAVQEDCPLGGGDASLPQSEILEKSEVRGPVSSLRDLLTS